MAATKQITVFVNRRFTLNRAGKDAVAFQPGANIVDADVAEHPFVKAHTVAATEGSAADLAADLKTAKDALAVMTKRAETAEAKVAELQAVLDAAAAMGDAGKQANNGKK